MSGRRAAAAAVLAAALVAHFGYFFADRAIQSDDSPTYVVPAQHLARGDGFLNAYGLAETRRTPGYPLFLVPFVNVPFGLVAAVALQHVMAAALAAGVFLLTADRLAAIAAGVYLAIDPASITHANQILTETLFTAVIFAAFALLARRRSAALAGLLAGFAVLVRPVGLYLVVPVVLVMLFTRELRRAIAFALCFAILPLGWSARNAARGAGFTISTITSWSMLFDRAAATVAFADGSGGASVVEHRLAFAREVGDEPPATYSNHIVRAIDHFHTERYTPLALRVIASHPLAYLRAYAVALARTLFGGGATQLHAVFGVPLRAAQAIVAGYGVVTTIVAAFGLIALWKRERGLALLSAAFVVYFLATCSMAEATSRFRVPLMPMMAIWFGAGVAALLRRWRERADLPA